MSLELPVPLQQALDVRPGEPLQLIDPRTQEAYVLVRAKTYESMKRLVEEEGPDPRELAALIEQTMREYDEDDPLLESYQKYLP